MIPSKGHFLFFRVLICIRRSSRLEKDIEGFEKKERV